MEKKLWNMLQGLIVSFLLVNVASSTLNEEFKPSLSPLSTSITTNQATATGSTPAPSSFCQAIVTQFGQPIITSLINNGQKPEKTCSMFGMCIKPEAGAAAGSTGETATGAFGFRYSQMLCGPCKMAIQTMKENLKSSKGQGDPTFGNKVCQSVSNIFKRPAQIYSPPANVMPAVQSVSEEQLV